MSISVLSPGYLLMTRNSPPFMKKLSWLQVSKRLESFSCFVYLPSFTRFVLIKWSDVRMDERSWWRKLVFSANRSGKKEDERASEAEIQSIDRDAQKAGEEDQNFNLIKTCWCVRFWKGYWFSRDNYFCYVPPCRFQYLLTGFPNNIKECWTDFDNVRFFLNVQDDVLCDWCLFCANGLPCLESG